MIRNAARRHLGREMSKFPKISDEEERELIALSEEDGWVSVEDIEATRAHWQQAARRALEGKPRRISIMVSERDLLLLKARAMGQGMPFSGTHQRDSSQIRRELIA